MALMVFKLFFAVFTKIDDLDLFLVKSAKTQVYSYQNTQKTQNKIEAPNFKIGASFILHAIFNQHLGCEKLMIRVIF